MAVQVRVVHDHDYGWLVETNASGDWEFEDTLRPEGDELVSRLTFKDAVALGRQVAGKYGCQPEVFTKNGTRRKRAA